METKKKRKACGGNTILGGRKALIFYIILMAIPVLQFCIFYIGVNFNSFLIAFQKTDILTNSKSFTTEHFERFWREMTVFTNMKTTVWNSIKVWLVSLVISTPLGLVISFYIYKKAVGSGVFKVIVFAPSIISSINPSTFPRSFCCFWKYFPDIPENTVVTFSITSDMASVTIVSGIFSTSMEISVATSVAAELMI